MCVQDLKKRKRKEEKKDEEEKGKRNSHFYKKIKMEPRNCFGNNRSVAQILMKFWVFVPVNEGYSNSSEGHQLIMLPLSGKHEILTFEGVFCSRQMGRR